MLDAFIGRAHTSQATVVDALRVFLAALLTGVLAPSASAPTSASSTPARFVRQLYETRYAPAALYYFCTDPELLASYESYCPKPPNPTLISYAQDAVKPLIDAYRLGFEVDAAPAQQRLNGVLRIVLESFVEHAVHRVLGLKGTCAFLQHCF